MPVQVPVSVGELLDKLTILAIKLQRIDDGAKLVNIAREQEALETVVAAAGLRAAAGIDLILGKGWGIRYAFLETIQGNPISVRLDPPGKRGLANFQNLFGVVKYF